LTPRIGTADPANDFGHPIVAQRHVRVDSAIDLGYRASNRSQATAPTVGQRLFRL